MTAIRTRSSSVWRAWSSDSRFRLSSHSYWTRYGSGDESSDISYAPYFYVKRSCGQPDFRTVFRKRSFVNHAVMGPAESNHIHQPSGTSANSSSEMTSGRRWDSTPSSSSQHWPQSARNITKQQRWMVLPDFQKILALICTLIMPTIILMLILQVGNIMNVGYESLSDGERYQHNRQWDHFDALYTKWVSDRTVCDSRW